MKRLYDTFTQEQRAEVRSLISSRYFNAQLEKVGKIEKGAMELGADEKDPSTIAKVVMVVDKTPESGDLKRSLSVAFLDFSGDEAQTAEGREKLLYLSGKEMAKLEQDVLAAYFVSDAYVITRTGSYDPMLEQMPSEADDRQEALVIGGITIDGRINYAQYTYARDNGQPKWLDEKVIGFSSSSNDWRGVQSPVESFMQGYIENRG